MSDRQEELRQRIEKIQSALDIELVGDNVSDIAEFTVEKFEFRTDSALPAEVREQAVTEIKDILWRRVERQKERRQEVLADMFNAAEAKLGEVIERSRRGRTSGPNG